MKIVIVAAVASNGVIGRQGKLPWHLPEDLRHFRKLTEGAAVLMGRATWDSLPAAYKPLPGRRNVVLSRAGEWAEGAEVANSLELALTLLAREPVVYVIGGAQLFAQLLRQADEVVLTQIDRAFDGDTHFPMVQLEAELKHRFDGLRMQTFMAEKPNDFTFSITTYRLKPA
jgi:dihydrofolate reductase